MARVIQTVELPDGSMQDVEVDDSWSSDEIRTRLRAKLGLDGESAETSVPKNTDEPDDLPPFEDEPATEREPSLGDRFMRQQELGTRAVIEGAVGFPLMIGDAANTLLNYIPGVELGMPSQTVRDAIPLAQPETAEERIASMVIQAGTGTAAGIKTASKLTTGAVNRFMTEEAGTQLAVGTAAGAGLGVAAEADLGPVGLIASGLAGGLAGGVGAKQSGKLLGRWADARMAEDVPITVKEVKQQVEADGQTATNAELRTMQETLEELRTAQKADDEIARLKPVASDPLEVARAKAAALRRMGGDDKANLPIETKRELARIQKRKIEETEAKVRALEEQRVQKTKEMQEANAVAEATQAELKANLGASSGLGDPTKMSTWGNAVISRIENVSPQLGMAVRRVSQRSATRTSDDIRRVDKFYNAPEYKALARADRNELDRAFLNGDREAADLIMAKRPGLSDLYEQNVRKLLTDIQTQRKAGGMDGFIEDFHPRVVRRLRALQKSRGKEVAGEVEQALSDAKRVAKAKGEHLSEHQIAAIINQRIGGRSLKVLKDRRINEITPDQQKFYSNSRDSLIDYVHNHHSATATRDFFKSNLGVERQLGQVMDEASLAKLMAKEMVRGSLTNKQTDELAKLLDAQFGISRAAPHRALTASKNVFTAGVLANPFSTITQFGDIAPLMRKFGVRQTMQSMFGGKALDVYDVGVRELSKDARSAHGTAKLVRNGLQFVGFDKLDKVMANTGVNAAFSKWTKLAGKKPKTTLAKLERVFGDDAHKVLDDLRNKRLTDDVKTLMLNEMGDIRPVSREDMPLLYQQHPNGRFMFSLLSWTMKQMNFARNEAMRDMKAGKYTKAVTGLVSFMALMGLTNGGAQGMKAWIRGDDVDPADLFIEGAFSVGMSGKYAMDAFNRNRSTEALGSILPVIGITFGAGQSAFNAVKNGEPTELLDMIPTFRNFKSFLTSDVVGAAASVPLAVGAAMIPEAEAMAHQPLTPAFEQVDRQAEAETGIKGARRLPAPPPEPEAEPEAEAPVPKNSAPAEQFKTAKEHIVLREGDRGDVYQNEIPDGKGGTMLDKPTVGIGHVLTNAERKLYPVGTDVPQKVRDAWFKKDTAKAFAAARKQAKEIGRPDMVAALASVNFQLGTGWNKIHKNTWEFMKQKDWTSAASEAADSRWFKQTPVRVRDLQKALLKGIG